MNWLKPYSVNSRAHGDQNDSSALYGSVEPEALTSDGSLALPV